jgi:hypothetical protein
LCTVTDSEFIIRNRRPLSEYFPETIERELQRYPRIPHLRDGMALAGFSNVTEDVVEFNYQLTDCSVYKAKTYSALQLISQTAYERGITRMEHDLQSGPIECVSRYLMLWGHKLNVSAALHQ